MFDVRWSRLPGIAAVPALAALAVAGCSSGGPAPHATQPANDHPASTSVQAALAAQAYAHAAKTLH